MIPLKNGLSGFQLDDSARRIFLRYVSIVRTWQRLSARHPFLSLRLSTVASPLWLPTQICTTIPFVLAVDDDIISNSALSRVSNPHHFHAVNTILASVEQQKRTNLRLSQMQLIYRPCNSSAVQFISNP